MISAKRDRTMPAYSSGFQNALPNREYIVCGLCVSIWVSSLPIALAGSADKAASPPAEDSQDGVALQKLVKTFEAAWNNADVESIALLFSPDGQLVTPNGTAKTRPQIKQLNAKERESRLREATIRQGVDRSIF